MTECVPEIEAAGQGNAFAQVLMGVLMCLRGTIFLYQGDELGLAAGRCAL